MRLPPDYAAVGRMAHAFSSKLRWDNSQQNVLLQEQMKEVKVALSTNQGRLIGRGRASSVHLEQFEELHQTLPDIKQQRFQSEEPDNKKRKHVVVDTDLQVPELAEGGVLSVRRITPVKQVKQVEIISLLDDEPRKEPRVNLLVSNTATRDALQPQPQERESVTAVQYHQEEYEKKQREEAEAYQRQLLQVNRNLQGDRMPKPAALGGHRPINRLGDNDTQQRDRRESNQRAWPRLVADASAGRGASQNPPFKPHLSNKRQRTETASTPTNVSSQSPIDLEHDTSERQRQGSAARSGRSLTLNDTNKNGYGRDPGVEEYRHVEETVRETVRPRRRPAASSMGRTNGGTSQRHKAFVGTVVRLDGEDATDPIVDSELEGDRHQSATHQSVMNRPSTWPSHPEVQIPCKGNAFLKAARSQADKTHGRKNKNERPSTSSEIAYVSPHFASNSNSNQGLRSSNERSTVNSGAVGRDLQAKNQPGRALEGKARGIRRSDLSIDELSFEYDPKKVEPEERKHYETAKRLLPKPVPYDLERPHSRQESINLDESDEEPPPNDNADIKPTNFSSGHQKKSKDDLSLKFSILQVFAKNGSLRWLFPDHQQTWSLEHDRKLSLLNIYDEKGEKIQCLTTRHFERVEFCEDSSKVVVHRSRDNNEPSARQIYLEFSGLDQSAEFVKELKSNYRILKFIPKNKDYLDKVFLNTPPQPSQMSKKRPLEEDDDLQLQLAKTKSERNHATRWSEIQNAKRARIDRFDGHQPQKNEQSALPRKQGLAESMKAGPIELDSDESRRHPFKHHELLAEDFYGVSTSGPAPESIPHVTRSLTRVAGVGAAAFSSTQRRTPTPPIPEGWTKLNPKWAMENNWKSSILYPQEGKNRAVVDMQDIPRLDEGEFLNDNLVTFYLRYLEHQLEMSDPEVAKRVYFHNSFFFSKLTTPPKGGFKGGLSINYEAVQKWTSKVNIFDYDYIVVPVNENLHWYVAIICNAPKLVQSPVEKGKDEKSQDEAKVVESAKAIQGYDGHSPSSDSGLASQAKDISLNDKLAEDVEPSRSASQGVSGHTELLSRTNGLELQDGQISGLPVASDLLPQNTKTNQTKKAKRKSAPAPRKYSPNEPRIITLDSFHLSRSPACTKLKRYLLQEMKTKLNIEREDPGPIGMTAKNIPLQDNSSDCGLFLLSYIEMFLKDPDGFIEGILQNTLDVEIDWPEASYMRTRVRELLFALQKEQNGGGEPKLDGSKCKSAATTEKKVDRNSTTKASVKTPATTKAVPISEKRQPTVPQPTGSNSGKHLPMPHGAVDTEQPLGSASGATHKQGGSVGNVYAAVSGTLSAIKNGIFRPPQDVVRKPAEQSQGFVEMEGSTQQSNHAGVDVSNTLPPEIGDSQAHSSQASSIGHDHSSPQNPTTQADAIEILSSPEVSKAKRKSKTGKKATTTSELRSPSPTRWPRGKILREQVEAKMERNPVKQLGSPSPRPEDFVGSDPNNTLVEDEDPIDLLEPMRVPQSLKGLSGHDEDQRIDSEMLFSGGEPNTTASTRDPDMRLLSSPAGSSSNRVSIAQKNHSENSAPMSPAPIYRGSPNVIILDDSPGGKKRKGPADNDEWTDHNGRHNPSPQLDSSDTGMAGPALKKQKSLGGRDKWTDHHGRHTPSPQLGSADAAIVGASQRRKSLKGENENYKQRRRPSPEVQLDPSAEVVIGALKKTRQSMTDGDSSGVERPLKKQRSLTNQNEPPENRQRPSSDLHRDPSDEAIIGNHGSRYS